jgi:hypothetical protein
MLIQVQDAWIVRGRSARTEHCTLHEKFVILKGAALKDPPPQSAARTRGVFRLRLKMTNFRAVAAPQRGVT